VANWLFELDIFSNLRHHTLIEVGLKLKDKTLKKGEVLCETGDEARSLCVVYNGELEVFVNDEIKGFCRSDEYIGRAALEKEGKITAMLRATSRILDLVLMIMWRYHLLWLMRLFKRGLSMLANS